MSPGWHRHKLMVRCDMRKRTPNACINPASFKVGVVLCCSTHLPRYVREWNEMFEDPATVHYIRKENRTLTDTQA